MKFINIFDVDNNKARQLANSLAAYRKELDIETSGIDTSRVDIIINASPVGIASESGMPIDPSLISRSHLVTDMIMMPVHTPLLVAAAEKGCQIVNGFAALLGQADAILDLFDIDANINLSSNRLDVENQTV